MAAQATMQILGNLQEFNPDNETIVVYLERMQMFFEVNNVEDAKRVPVLLTANGAKYSLLRDLVSPATPREKSLDELVKVLKDHFEPKPLVIAERYRFYHRDQRTDESIAEYLAVLKKLASTCKFRNFLDEALRDRLVCGVRSKAIQKKLLAEDGLTLA
jgi:hypothetical protein